MNPPRLFGLFVLLVFLQSYCYAQDKSNVRFGKVIPEDFKLPVTPIIDSNTNAVIVYNAGSVSFIGNKQGWFSNVFKRQTRIKILNKQALELATEKIHLYVNGDNAEKLDNLSASTYNLEDGKVIETKLDKNELFEEKSEKHHTYKKFTMPAVREGSIIEFSYTVTSPYNLSLPEWEFQSARYPCLWSEYSVDIPQTLSYVFVRQGVHGFVIDKSGTGHESYRVTERADPGSIGSSSDGHELFVSANTIKHQWAMKDIPAFRVESYLSSPSNYLDKIDLQLSGTYNGEESFNKLNNWKKATEELLTWEDFAGSLKDDNDWLNDTLIRVAGNISVPLEQARAIYYYVSNSFNCNNHYDKYIRTSLREVFKKNSGDVGELNLLMIAMLRKRGIVADPVLLSTRDYGFNLANYPVLDKLNYVITRVKIDGIVYYLDPAHPHLGFGRLDGDCYNGHARIISNVDSGSVFFWADSLKERKTTMVLISNSSNGVLEGSFQSTLGGQESYNTRRTVSEIGEKNYFKHIQTAYGEDLEIEDPSIDSLKRPEDPVKINYNFKYKQVSGSSLIYFNPLFSEAWRENPFKAAERKYPVEMPYAMDYNYIFNMDIPEGYVVDELPKSAKVVYNGEEGSFEYIIGKDGGQIQLRCRLQLNKANFTSEDYSTLRDFFTFVVKKENEPIVLKKKP
jgi:transglutaminase-like putative cysteine protease